MIADLAGGAFEARIVFVEAFIVFAFLVGFAFGTRVVLSEALVVLTDLFRGTFSACGRFVPANTGDTDLICGAIDA